MSWSKKNTITEENYKKKLSRYVAIDSSSIYRGTLVGFELEVENIAHRPLTGLNTIGVEAVSDGSLRNNGAEFVFTGPVAVDTAKESITALCAKLKEGTRSPSFSDRTSAHFHINARDITYEEYHKFLTLWYLVEALVVRRSGGEDREGNLFCLRGLDSNGIIENLKAGFRGDYFMVIPQERYVALNLQAFRKFGSFEFRPHRGTADPSELHKFLDAIVEIFEKSKTFPTARNILEESSKLGGEEFLKKFLPVTNTYIHETVSEDTTVGEDFFTYYDEGVALSQELAYCVEIVPTPKTPAPSKKEVSFKPFTPLSELGETPVRGRARVARRRATPAPSPQTVRRGIAQQIYSDWYGA